MFKFFGKRGQSSSVFNLLIAALVSLAILGLLLTILSGIGVFGGNKPDETALKILKNASQKSYMPYNESATFSKTNSSISTMALAQDLSIGQENILLKNCSSSQQFVPNEGPLIKYTGGSDKEFQLVGICGYEAITSETVGIPAECGTLEPQNNEFSCYLLITNKTG